MSWLKFTFLDIIAVILIAAFAFTHNNVIEIIIWVYTGILLLSKVLYFFIGFLQNKASKTEAPDWFYHVIYLASIGLLLYSQNYYLTASWAIIWILSILSTFKKSSSKK